MGPCGRAPGADTGSSVAAAGNPCGELAVRSCTHVPHPLLHWTWHPIWPLRSQLNLGVSLCGLQHYASSFSDLQGRDGSGHGTDDPVPSLTQAPPQPGLPPMMQETAGHAAGVLGSAGWQPATRLQQPAAAGSGQPPAAFGCGPWRLSSEMSSNPTSDGVGMQQLWQPQRLPPLPPPPALPRAAAPPAQAAARPAASVHRQEHPQPAVLCQEALQAALAALGEPDELDAVPASAGAPQAAAGAGREPCVGAVLARDWRAGGLPAVASALACATPPSPPGARWQQRGEAWLAASGCSAERSAYLAAALGLAGHARWGPAPVRTAQALPAQWLAALVGPAHVLAHLQSKRICVRLWPSRGALAGCP